MRYSFLSIHQLQKAETNYTQRKITAFNVIKFFSCAFEWVMERDEAYLLNYLPTRASS